MKPLKCKILGLGAWGNSFHNWPDLENLLQHNTVKTEQFSDPKPDIIPTNERRRAPLPVRLAIESSWQATQAANIDPAKLSCTFASGLGDIQLNQYMCEILAQDPTLLSPTKFHNSVHNAAAGYWTISTGCMQAANSIAGFNESVPLTLLEAITQCVYENKPVLLTFYDAPVTGALKSLYDNEQSFAVSMVIAPHELKQMGTILSMDVTQQTTNWPTLNLNHALQHCYQHNPAARILVLLTALADHKQANTSVNMPLSSGSTINLNLHYA